MIFLVLYERLESKHQDIPFEADLGETGTPYIEEFTIQRGKTLDVIHGADPSWPADRNPKFSAKRENSSTKRKELCDRLCGRTTNSGYPLPLTLPDHEGVALLPYSEYRAIASIGLVTSGVDNASTGFDDDQDLETS